MSEKDLTSGTFTGTLKTSESIYELRFNGSDQAKEYLRITVDGRIIPGPGLSMDEATQGAAKMLAEHYGRQMELIRKENEKDA